MRYGLDYEELREVVMLNNRKVRLMTRLAIYEQTEGKEDVRISKYFRTDYVRLNVLKSIVAVTVG